VNEPSLAETYEAIPEPALARVQPGLVYGFRPAALLTMVGCVALSLVGLVQVFAPDWNGTYLLVMLVSGAALGYYLRVLARQHISSDQERQRLYRLVLGVSFVAVKAGVYLSMPWERVQQDIQQWFAEPWYFFSLEFIVTFGLFVGAWLAAMATAADWEALEDPVRDRTTASPVQRLAARFFVAGMLLLITGGLTRIGLADLLNLARPSTPGISINALVYFLLGLAMLGQARFTALRTLWGLQKTPVAVELASRWARYSLIFLVLAAALAFILPTRYATPLFDLLLWLMGIGFSIMSLVLFVFQIFLYPFLWLLSLIQQTDPPDAPLLPQNLIPPAPPEAATPWPWLGLVRSLLFWGLLLGIGVYLIHRYLREHPELLRAVQRVNVVRVLGDWIAALWRALRGWGRDVQAQVVAAVQRQRDLRRARDKTRRRAAAPGSSRAWVLRHYAELLAETARSGLPRRDAQTPREYQQTLQPALPAAAPPLEQVTTAFIEARYSAHPIPPELQAQMETACNDVRAALAARESVDPAQDKGDPSHGR